MKLLAPLLLIQNLFLGLFEINWNAFWKIEVERVGQPQTSQRP